MAAEDHQSVHLAVFPWLAFGHIIPYLELSKHIAQKGHRISFISTPRNIDRLPKLPPHLSSSIALVKIPLPTIAELPENAEATMDIHGAQMDHLKTAFDGLEAGLTRILEDSRPDWILYDFAAHWLPPVAAGLGISRAFFLNINACGSNDRTKPEDFTVPPKWVKFETKVAYRRYEADWIFGAGPGNKTGFSDFYRLGKVIVGCEAILARHCYEFEPAWLTLLEEIHHRPVIPLGLMPPKVQDHTITNDGNHEIWTSIKNWLDSQNKGSVVYVALGSEVTPTPDQFVELAYGLELSGVPFFWVLRKVSGSDPMELPSGFEERVSGRGIVWRSWAPQLEILSHESVGGFLTHCGWSSIVEGLMFGHPLITLPFLVDQGLNSRVVVEKTTRSRNSKKRARRIVHKGLGY
ncbi:putative UDP-rhamnose:rhamnosyltransferase 1 [Sesamum alatum]|uniref:Glycosyltransferase n=1 Tax=Sesamum alatum TaxID=300844 RepID=A0AAE1XS72_9LAMI|nr:putative UDP-rhamnose:rhamnosyltransferase 1 [Sesamum alatum]